MGWLSRLRARSGSRPAGYRPRHDAFPFHLGWETTSPMIDDVEDELLAAWDALCDLPEGAAWVDAHRSAISQTQAILVVHDDGPHGLLLEGADGLRFRVTMDRMVDGSSVSAVAVQKALDEALTSVASRLAISPPPGIDRS